MAFIDERPRLRVGHSRHWQGKEGSGALAGPYIGSVRLSSSSAGLGLTSVMQLHTTRWQT